MTFPALAASLILSKPLLVRANLFIVGAPKCGTTAWVRYLGSHPEVFFSEMKEPNYFATDFPRMRLVSEPNNYERLFARAGDAKAVGEASAIYLYSKEAAEGIRTYNPEARILIFLRGQESFLPALHHQLLYRFVEPLENFETAWRLSGKRPPETIPKTCRDPKLLDYAAFGRFGEQVERYLARFPREQVRIVRFEEWTANPRAVYLDILRFLELDDDGRTAFPTINEAKSFRNAWIGRLIAHPPLPARAAVNMVKKLTGRSGFGIAEKASEMLATKGYRTAINENVLEEISRYYAQDNRLLEKLIAAPAKRSSGARPAARCP
jgi:Sulfotransferase family